ncbi:hypothetical protein [Synechococcus sp. CC9605]|uniref:hypothetical protein n=1 Tax=Synechococcus sp. (strain CC9605) TaxID=110662 RepID=UPI002152E085|nr:hypothetical protein [Synechococcus sp. CC9605]
MVLAEKLDESFPVWRRSTGNHFTGPHHRPGGQGIRLDVWSGNAKRHLYGNAPGVDTAGHKPQAEV